MSIITLRLAGKDPQNADSGSQSFWKTILVKPYPPCEFDEEKEMNLKYYADILGKVKELLEDNELLKTIMEKYDKQRLRQNMQQIEKKES